MQTNIDVCAQTFPYNCRSHIDTFLPKIPTLWILDFFHAHLITRGGTDPIPGISIGWYQQEILYCISEGKKNACVPDLWLSISSQGLKVYWLKMDVLISSRYVSVRTEGNSCSTVLLCLIPKTLYWCSLKRALQRWLNDPARLLWSWDIESLISVR